jgi:hypothetical protein
MPDISLDAADAAELTELLHFLTDWFVVDHYYLWDSLTRFVGGRGYDLDQLACDLHKFAFLLGGTDELLQPPPR